MGGTDWILFVLLGLLWLATGGLPLSALRHRQGTKSGTLPPRGEPDHAFLWRRIRRRTIEGRR